MVGMVVGLETRATPSLFFWASNLHGTAGCRLDIYTYEGAVIPFRNSRKTLTYKPF